MRKILLLAAFFLEIYSVHAKTENITNELIFADIPASANALLIETNTLSTFNFHIQLNDTIKIDLQCTPIDYNPKILSGADPKLIHTDWKESEVGTSWTFFATKKIINTNGIFLYGDLISPRGGIITKGCYVINSEWE